MRQAYLHTVSRQMRFGFLHCFFFLDISGKIRCHLSDPELPDRYIFSWPGFHLCVRCGFAANEDVIEDFDIMGNHSNGPAPYWAKRDVRVYNNSGMLIIEKLENGQQETQRRSVYSKPTLLLKCYSCDFG